MTDAETPRPVRYASAKCGQPPGELKLRASSLPHRGETATADCA
jgi:hypothetical protein